MTGRARVNRGANLIIARKQHTCAFCEGIIEKGEGHVVWVLLPSQHFGVDTPWRGHGHEACNAFWCELVGPEWGRDGELPDWDEAKREFGWDEWLAAR